MKKNNLKLKILYSFILVNFIFCHSIGIAQAGLFGSSPSIPSFEEIADKAESRYGFDSNILRNSEKGIYPQADVFFDNTAPNVGEKVTATAMPKYFRNSNENLYYTWFLFREDENGDIIDDIDEAKRLAMGIVARGDFDPFLFDTDYSDGSSDSDRDGYDASFGGGDGVGGRSGVPGGNDEYESDNYIDPVSEQVVDTNAISRCYRHNFGVSNPEDYSLTNPGGDLIIECEHKFPEANSGDTFENPYDATQPDIECEDNYDVGDGEFTTNEEACWRLDPTNSDTDGDGINDEADLAGLGQTQLTWTFEAGDRVGVMIEGTSMVIVNEASGDVSDQDLTRVITYDCSNTSDGTYCVNGTMEIGECQSGSCTSSSCSDPSDSGDPCEVSGGGTGVCDAMGIGNCVAVSICTTTSDGDLCESEGIEGTCESSVCIISRCGSAEASCQTYLGEIGFCTSSAVCADIIDGKGTSSVFGDSAANPYYKLAWAGMDVCDKELVESVGSEDYKEDLIEDDECDGSGDYGFTYSATKSVFEQGTELLKSNLTFTPSAPQLNFDNNSYSDYITISSNFTQSDIVDDFIYYDWDIYYCEEESLGNCTEDSNNKLTTACTDGSVLGSCADGIISDSYAEGMGITNIRFKLDDNFISDNNPTDSFYLKAFLRTKENKNDSTVGISSVDIPVVINDNIIRFFKVSEQSTGNYGFDESLDEICATGDYNKICPVFPGQVIAAKVEIDTDGTGDTLSDYSFSWELNKEKLVAPKTGSTTCSFENDGCSLSEIVYLPISGGDMELQSVSLKAQKTNGEEITSERIISVAEPMVKMESQDLLTAMPWVVDDGSTTGKESSLVFVGIAGETVSLDAKLVPSYLDNDLTANNISLVWYFDGQEVDTDFRNNNSNYNIVINNQNLSFTLDKEEGDSMNIVVELKKEFSTDEEDLLVNNWGIENLRTIETEKSITLKVTDGTNSPFVMGSSINAFTASTLDNASEYIVFVIRAAIVFVLFWFFLFGFNYWFSREIRLEK